MSTPILTDLGGIPQFDCKGEPTTVGARWRKWRRAFEFFIEGKGVRDAKQMKAMLLHCGGMDLQDVYFTLPEAPEPGEGETVFTVAMAQLDRHFTPQVNVPYERHLFRNMAQLPTESIDQYVRRLRQRADYCQFENKVDENIRHQVIEKCLSNRLRAKLLEKGAGLTLAQLQSMARAMEASIAQADSIASSNTTQEVNRIHSKREKPKQPRNRDTKGEKRCYRCDNLGHLSSDEKCPARGKKCNKCHGVGHFAKCCKSKKTPKAGKQAANFVETEEEFAFVVTGKIEPEITLNVGGIPNIKFIIDSGASCNVIDRQLWEMLKANKVKCETQKCHKKLFTYGSTEPLKIAGTFTACIQCGKQSQNAEFTVIEGKGQALLGRDTATQLGVLTITDPSSPSVNPRIQDKGLTLNKEKCKFHMSELEFMGHLLSARGIGPTKKSNPCARVNRWVLRLQPYDFVVKHIPGKTNIADVLSRLTSDVQSSNDSAEDYVHYIAKSATPRAMSTREIEEPSATDEELCNLRKCYREKKWNNLQNKRYLLVKNELSVVGKLVLRGTRIIMPTSLREKTLHIAHEGHPGIVAMKRLLRTKVWWPGLDKDAQELCKTCHPCQVVGAPNPPEPIKPTELPKGPWQHIWSSDGVQYRRNSSHLKVFNEPKLPETVCEQPIHVDKPSDDTEPSEILPTNQTELDVPTRPTRSRKLPARFNDFELYKDSTGYAKSRSRRCSIEDDSITVDTSKKISSTWSNISLAHRWPPQTYKHVYLKRINKHLAMFIEGWDRHKISSCNSMTPNQLWIYGLHSIANSGSTIAQEIWEPLSDDEAASYGIDHERPTADSQVAAAEVCS
eukprot:gene4282-4850_t